MERENMLLLPSPEEAKIIARFSNACYYHNMLIIMFDMACGMSCEDKNTAVCLPKDDFTKYNRNTETLF